MATNQITGLDKQAASQMAEYHKLLEDRGFRVEQSESLVNYEPATVLMAHKGNVTLRVSRYAQNGWDLAVQVIKHGAEQTIPLVPYNFETAVKIAESLAGMTETRQDVK